MMVLIKHVKQKSNYWNGELIKIYINLSMQTFFKAGLLKI